MLSTQVRRKIGSNNIFGVSLQKIPEQLPSVSKMNILTLFLVFSSFLVLTYGSEDQKKKKSKKVPKTHGFFVGQIPLGRFEYPELNTLLKPNQAQIICENDLECAGFTFKGPKNHLDIPHPITFFRFVSESTFTETKRANLHWTSYRVKRNFVIVAGKKFPNSRVIKVWKS